MRSSRVFALAALVVLAVSACSDVTAPAGADEILAGLVSAVPQDSAGAAAPPPSGGTGSGYFRGYVRGPNTPGAGGDTLATSPRIAGVVVRAYEWTSGGPGQIVLGDLVGEVVTDAQGAFTFPTIPGGDYAVTFRPPTNSGYQGVWVTAPIHSTSHEWPWWVTLPRS